MTFVPQHAGPLTIHIASAGTHVDYTYEVYPTIASIVPSSGIVTGQNQATITGSGFSATTQVIFTPQAGGNAGWGTQVIPNGNGTQATLTVPASPLPTNQGAGKVNVATIVDGLQSPYPVTYTYARAGEAIPSYQYGNCVGPEMVVSAYDANNNPIPSGTPLTASVNGSSLAGLTVGMPFPVQQVSTYQIQIQGYPAFPVTVPFLPSYCVQLTWQPNLSLPLPSQVTIIPYSITGGNIDTWSWTNPTLGSFSFTLNSSVSAQVASNIVAVIPTKSYEQSLLSGAPGVYLSANGAVSSLSLAGTIFNLTAPSQENTFQTTTPEVFLPVLGTLTLQLPSGGSSPSNQYRILHAEDVSGTPAWHDVTSSFGSGVITASGLLDKGWYALAKISTPVALSSPPPPAMIVQSGFSSPCEKNGAAATFAGVCCSDQIQSGACECLAPGQSCTSDQGCCSNWCSGFNASGVGTCMQAPLQAACQASPFHCASQPALTCECAGPNSSSACVGGLCCSEAFGPCLDGQADCCPGNTCVNGACLINSGQGVCNQSPWSQDVQNASCVSASCNLATGICH